MLQIILELKKCNQEKSMMVRSGRLQLQKVFWRTRREFKRLCKNRKAPYVFLFLVPRLNNANIKNAKKM